MIVSCAPRINKRITISHARTHDKYTHGRACRRPDKNNERISRQLARDDHIYIYIHTICRYQRWKYRIISLFLFVSPIHNGTDTVGTTRHRCCQFTSFTIYKLSTRSPPVGFITTKRGLRYFRRSKHRSTFPSCFPATIWRCCPA